MFKKIIAFLKTNRVTLFLTKTRKRKVFFVILLLLFVLYQINSSRQPDLELEVIRVEKKTLEENISASGKVDAEKLAELTFLASENIEEIFVADGSYVEKGDLIARLNSTSLYQSYLQAEASLRAAEAAVDKVYDDLQGKESTETFAEINTRTSAEVARDNAYRTFVIAQKNLSNANLYAPFAGIVNQNDGTSIGELSTSLSPTFTIVDPSTVYFAAEINEVDIPNIKVGTPARLELDAYGDEVLTESVTSVGFVDTITSTGGTAYRVRISLPGNADSKFRVGMNGDVELILSEKKGVVSIPQSAIVEENGNSFVWVVKDDGKAAKIPVETGVSSINDIEILNGLEEGNLVVERPPSQIEEGHKIRIIIEGEEDEQTGGFGGLFQ